MGGKKYNEGTQLAWKIFTRTMQASRPIRLWITFSNFIILSVLPVATAVCKK